MPFDNEQLQVSSIMSGLEGQRGKADDRRRVKWKRGISEQELTYHYPTWSMG